MAKDNFKLHGTTPYMTCFGDEGDISSLSQVRWYEWCYFWDQKANFPYNCKVLGRVLGPACGEGNEMSQWVLKTNGNVVPCHTVQSLCVAEAHSPMEAMKWKVFDALIERRWGTSISPQKSKRSKMMMNQTWMMMMS